MDFDGHTVWVYLMRGCRRWLRLVAIVILIWIAGDGRTTVVWGQQQNGNESFGSPEYPYGGPTNGSYGALTFPRGQILFSNTNTQNQLYSASNAYMNLSGSWSYRNNGPAVTLGLDNGVMNIYTAASGSKDTTVPWNYAMTIGTSGLYSGIGGTNAQVAIATTDGNSSGLVIGNGSAPRFAVNPNSDGSWTMFDFGAGHWVSGITQKSGNVGIGTANPQYLLSVNGQIGAKEVIVTNSGWSDDVFQPGYRLRPLSEINAYIQANHHLPGVPFEAEVKETGVSVADMQAKLLAKIEELTLHMIQAEERSNRLEQQNRDLVDRLAQLESRGAGR